MKVSTYMYILILNLAGNARVKPLSSAAERNLELDIYRQIKDKRLDIFYQAFKHSFLHYYRSVMCFLM